MPPARTSPSARPRAQRACSTRCGGCSSCPDGVEVFPGHVAGLALRQGDELEGVDHDRLRAPLQPDALAGRSSTRSSPSRPRSGHRSRPTSGRIVGAQPGPVPRRRPRRAPGRGSTARGAAPRRATRRRPPPGPCPRCGERPRLGFQLRDEGRFRARRRPERDRARRDDSRGPAGNRGLALGRLPRDRRLHLGGGPERSASVAMATSSTG